MTRATYIAEIDGLRIRRVVPRGGRNEHKDIFSIRPECIAMIEQLCVAPQAAANNIALLPDAALADINNLNVLF